MANVCFYHIRYISGDKSAMKELALYFKGKKEKFLCGVRTDETYFDENELWIDGGCKWSAYVSMLEGGYYSTLQDSDLTNLEILTKELGLKISLIANEFSCEVEEDYHIDNGIVYDNTI